MSTVARRMTYCILLTLAIGVIACAGTHANPPGKAPGYHQDLWDEVAYLTAPSTTQVASGPSPLTDARYGSRASELVM